MWAKQRLKPKVRPLKVGKLVGNQRPIRVNYNNIRSMRRSRVFCYWGLGIVIELEVNERSE